MMEKYRQANEGIRVPRELKARTVRTKTHEPRRWAGPVAAAAAAVLALVCGLLLWPRGETPQTAGGGQNVPLPSAPPILAAPLSMAFEPDYTIPYDGAELDEGYLAAIRAFAASAGKELLDGDRTTAYSPTTLYTALSMTAELADGSSRAALLSALNAESTDVLRRYSGDLWRYLCANPDTKEPGKVAMANSLWLNGAYRFHNETLKSLADYYYVSGRTGDMVNELPTLVSQWVREQTGGLLDCQIEPDEDTMAVLLSAVYFYDRWAEPFQKSMVTSGSFRTEGAGAEDEEGRYVRCMYMGRTEKDRAYYQGSGVTAAVQYFQNGGKLLFILPDEGRGPADVLNDGDLLTALLDWERLDRQNGNIDWIIPQFTLSDTLDLQDGLTALGLGELFDPYHNALPLLSGDGTPAYISQARQGAAISIDETGCEAASYVEIMIDKCAAAMEGEMVQMHLTRPFVFAILSENDVPLFLGVVNDPNG